MTCRHASARTLALIALMVGFVLAQTVPAFAHVDLAESNPANGADLDESPTEIELTFTADVALAGDGLLLIDATGDEHAINVEQAAADHLVVVPSATLPAGSYAVSWTVRSGDAHPRSGLVGFTISGTAVSPSADSNTAPIAAAAEHSADLEGTETDASSASVAASAFIVESAPPPGEGIARMGRWLSLLGALVGLGVIAFAATTLVGTRREVAEATFWIRRSGVAIVVGTALEVLGTSMMLSGSLWAALLPSGLLAAVIGPFGLAVALRIGGGVAMLRGTTLEALPTRERNTTDRRAEEPSPSPDQNSTLLTSAQIVTRHRMKLTGSAVAIVGAAAVAISYLFDGHTVTTAPAVIVRLAAVTHVVAGGVWVGGVLMLGRLLTLRRSRGVPLQAAELAIRFSQVAAAALAAVAAAGLALTWAILDAPAELISTPWGRFLLLKLALVGVAVGLGGYNHRFVVPLLDSDDDEELSGNRLRRVVRIEGAVLVGVVAVTAALVGAAS